MSHKKHSLGSCFKRNKIDHKVAHEIIDLGAEFYGFLFPARISFDITCFSFVFHSLLGFVQLSFDVFGYISCWFGLLHVVDFLSGTYHSPPNLPS